MSDDSPSPKDAVPSKTKLKRLEALLVRILISGTCVGVLVALLLPSGGSRVSPNRTKCRNNLKSIGLALLNYEYANKCFPPAYTVDEQGRPMHSWRALILPHMENQSGKLEYDFSQPWNSPRNIEFAEQSPLYDFFHCPNDSDDARKRRDTSYVILVGPNVFGSVDTPRTFTDIKDGSSNTIMTVEMSRSGIFWTEPRDLKSSEMSDKLNDPVQIGPRSEHGGGLYVGLADGSVRFFSDQNNKQLLKPMITINGGENMEDFNKRDY